MCQESKARQIFAKSNISYSMIRTRTCVYQGIRNVRFSENLAQFVFLKHPVWGSSFCLITHDFRIYFIKDGTLCDSTFWKEENSLRKKLNSSCILNAKLCTTLDDIVFICDSPILSLCGWHFLISSIRFYASFTVTLCFRSLIFSLDQQ